MRNYVLCLLAAFLSSCANIRVDDFGSYWAKGYVDPELVGRWEITTPQFEDNRKEARSVKIVIPISEVVNNQDVYQIDSLINEERQKKNYSPNFGRSLHVGPYTFLMEGDATDYKDHRLTRGTLDRYKYSAGIVTLYALNPKKMSEYLRDNYPEVKNIDSNCYEKRAVKLAKQKPAVHYDDNKNSEPVCTRVKNLDANVYKILSTIPDTPEFWGEPEEISSFWGKSEETVIKIKHANK